MSHAIGAFLHNFVDVMKTFASITFATTYQPQVTIIQLLPYTVFQNTATEVS